MDLFLFGGMHVVHYTSRQIHFRKKKYFNKEDALLVQNKFKWHVERTEVRIFFLIKM